MVEHEGRVEDLEAWEGRAGCIAASLANVDGALKLIPLGRNLEKRHVIGADQVYSNKVGGLWMSIREVDRRVMTWVEDMQVRGVMTNKELGLEENKAVESVRQAGQSLVEGAKELGIARQLGTGGPQSKEKMGLLSADDIDRLNRFGWIVDVDTYEVIAVYPDGFRYGFDLTTLAEGRPELVSEALINWHTADAIRRMLNSIDYNLEKHKLAVADIVPSEVTVLAESGNLDKDMEAIGTLLGWFGEFSHEMEFGGLVYRYRQELNLSVSEGERRFYSDTWLIHMANCKGTKLHEGAVELSRVYFRLRALVDAQLDNRLWLEMELPQVCRWPLSYVTKNADEFRALHQREIEAEERLINSLEKLKESMVELDSNHAAAELAGAVPAMGELMQLYEIGEFARLVDMVTWEVRFKTGKVGLGELREILGKSMATSRPRDINRFGVILKQYTSGAKFLFVDERVGGAFSVFFAVKARERQNAENRISAAECLDIAGILDEVIYACRQRIIAFEKELAIISQKGIEMAKLLESINASESEIEPIWQECIDGEDHIGHAKFMVLFNLWYLEKVKVFDRNSVGQVAIVNRLFKQWGVNIKPREVVGYAY